MGILIQSFLIAFAVGLASSKFSTSFPAVITTFSSNEENACSSECINGIANNGVEFAENTKYGYEFNAKTTIVPPTGSEEGISEISIRGKAIVIGTKKCGAILYLNHLKITQGSKVYDNTDLEGKPILFSYNNGKVGENICSSPDDSDSSMNLKRAIVSAFQVSLVRNPQKQFVETDNQGACVTTYSSSSSDSYLTIVKDKDLTQCVGYDNINLFGLSSPESNMVYQDSPFSSAVQRAEVKIIDSTIKTVTSLETLLYRPFGPIDTVTKIIVSMSLDLKKRSAVQAPDMNFVSKRRSIIFETPKPTIGSVDVDALVSAINLAITNLEPVVDIRGADSFANLVALFKVAKKDDIFSAFQQISHENRLDDPNIVETIFIDALIAANSGGSIGAVAELIHNHKLSDSLTVLWFKNLAKAKNPTKEAIVLASSLLNDRALKEGYIGVGSLLQKYLKDTQDYDSAEVRNTLNNLGAPLQKDYSGPLSSNDENLIIASLIGLGNARYIDSELEDLIIKLIMDKNVKQRIRAAALVMVKIYAKNPKIEKACESIFTDIMEDSEVRILAFKVFAINPSNHKASVIKNILDDKTCQLQIRTFLFSYLNNLQTTNDEGKLDQKKFYEGINTGSSKRMYSDILRYSQSSEYSQKFPFIHSGVLLDTEVIYSQKSFLPRCTSASLKTLLFGRKLNIFDFQMRAENIESMLEILFGPNGHFAKSNNTAFDDVKNYVTQAVMYAKERGLNNLDSDLPSKKSNGDISEEDLNKTYIDIVLNVFENDIGWFAFEGIESQITYQNIIDSVVDNLHSSLPKENNIELNLRKRIPIIDYENKYATSSGLPVSLKFQATTAIKIDTATKFDLEDFLAHPENSNFSLSLIPSGSLTLNTQITVDGYAVEVGQKIASSLHTSTGFHFSLNIVEGRGFEMVYGLPLDEMDLISIKSGAYSTIQERGIPLQEKPLSTPGVKKHTYTKNFEKLSEATGLSFFVHYDLPWNGHIMESVLPFAGTSSISLKVLKVDKQLTKYVMKGTYDFKSPMLKYIKFMFVTPKSDIKRGVALLIGYDTSVNNKFVAELKTPSSKVILQSVLVNSDEQKTIEIQYLDGAKYVFNLGVKCEKVDQETNKYFPIFETGYSTDVSTKSTRHPSLPNFDIEGYVLVKRNMNSNSQFPSKFTLQDMAVVTPNNKHSLRGTWTFENNKATGEANLTTYGVTFNMYGLISGEYPVYKSIGMLDVIKNKPSQERSLSNYGNEPVSLFENLLHKIEPVNLHTSQEIHIKAPYIFLSNNYVIWNNGHFKLNGDFLIEDKGLTMHGNISFADLLDSVLNANMTILPSTEDSGIFVEGLLQHSFIHDTSYIGYGDFKFIQNKDKKDSYFEFNSEHPKTLGVFHFNTKHQLTDESFKYNLHYDSLDGVVLNGNVDIITDDINFNINFDSPNPEYKSFVIVHGWLEKPNTYKFDTKFLWPGPQNLNYLNADGNLFLNGLESHLSGNVDCPAAHLVNVHVAIDSTPNPEIKDGGIATVRCVANEQVLLSEKIKYQLKLNNGEVHISGESIYKDSQNLIPIHFLVEFKNYIDQDHNTGKELAYKIALIRNNHKLIYQKNIQVTNHMLVYRQLHQINDDEQKVSIDLDYDFTSVWNWSYHFKSKIISPPIFHFLIHDDQDLLDCYSYIKFSNNVLSQKHFLKIFSYGDLSDYYEFKLILSLEKSVLKLVFGQREIRGLWRHSLEPIEGGYLLKYKGDVWFDYTSDPTGVSTLSLDAYYSLHDGLSTAYDLRIDVPYFENKNITVKYDIQLLKSWENLLSVKVDLDIFVIKEQALQLHTNFKRNVQNSGILYSADLLAKSDGMKLNYLVRDSILISSDRWGKYLDVYFVDSENITRPIQLHFELVPKGLNNKINIFGVTVINVNSSINVKDGALNSHTSVDYNNHPYLFKTSLRPGNFNFIMGWTDKEGIPEELMIDGSINMDESAVVSATRTIHNGTGTIEVGFIEKSLKKENWWETNDQMSSDKWNPIWQALKGEFISRFIEVHGNYVNISSMATSQRELRKREAENVHAQYPILMEYLHDEGIQIFFDFMQTDYLTRIPQLTINSTEIFLVGTIDFLRYIEIVKSIKNINKHINNYLKDMYKRYSKQIDLFMNKIARDYQRLLDHVNQTLLDLLKLLKLYSDKPMTDMSSEPRSLSEHYNGVIQKLINMIKELKVTTDKIKKNVEDYVMKLPIYDVFYKEIEKLRNYPYKDKLWEKIHDQLKEMAKSAPTTDLSDFIKALDTYIYNTIYDQHDAEQKDLINLRIKGILLAKSIIFNFPNYVSYQKAMSVYNALRKLTVISKAILYFTSPNAVELSDDSHIMLFGLSEYVQFCHQFMNPSYSLPPYKVQGVVIGSTNIITYNDQPYSFKPNTGTYVLAKDYKNNKFSILANYNDNVLTSITVLNNNGETYVLLSGGSITLNGKDIDFPLISDNAKTWKDVYSFGIEIAVGVRIKCTLELEIIEVSINGFYFGRVYGLLGAMNQEPTFDFKLTDGKVSENMASFLLAYRQTGDSTPTVVDLVQTDQPPCPSLFSGVSTMREAFSTVPPKAYRTICNQMVSSAKSQQDGLSKACLVSRAYVSMARNNLVSSCSVPDECISTTVNRQLIKAKTSVQISDPSDTADVMILFEETAEIEHFINLLNPFIEKVTKYFNHKKIKDINFIIIGYSGNPTDSEVHIYSANKDNDFSRISSNTLELSESETAVDGLSSQLINSYKKVMGQNSKDKAYKLSAEYPFRPDSVKAVISIANTLYTQRSLDVSLYTFNYVTSSYADQGIKFYLIAPIHLNDPSTDDIFGSSGTNTVYSMSDPKGRDSEDGFTYDQSLETDLVLKTNGAMYDGKFFTDVSDDDINIFIRSLTVTIVNNAVKDSTVEKTCSNSLYNGVMPYARCTVETY